MRTLHVFQSKDALKRGYDAFWEEHGSAVQTHGPYWTQMKNGEYHRFAVIRGGDDFSKVIGTRWDDINLMEAVTEHTGDFLRSLLIPNEESIVVDG